MHLVGSFPSPTCCLFPSFCLHLLWCVCSATEELKLSYYFCVGIFCFPSQTGTMGDFSQDLNCMSVPFSPENGELLLPLAVFEVLLYPGNFPFWFVMHILGFSWNSQHLRTAGSSSSLYQGGRIIPLCSHGNFSLSFLTSKAPPPNFKIVFYSYSCYLFSCCFQSWTCCCRFPGASAGTGPLPSCQASSQSSSASPA